MITPQPGGAVYAQLAAILRDEIHAGRLQPGQRLPSETTLTQQYGLARETVRRAAPSPSSAPKGWLSYAAGMVLS